MDELQPANIATSIGAIGIFSLMVIKMILEFKGNRNSNHQSATQSGSYLNGRACSYNAELNQEVFRNLNAALERVADNTEQQTSVLSELKTQNVALQTALNLFNTAFGDLGKRNLRKS